MAYYTQHPILTNAKVVFVPLWMNSIQKARKQFSVLFQHVGDGSRFFDLKNERTCFSSYKRNDVFKVSTGLTK